MLNKDNNMLCLSHRLLLVIAFLGLFLFEYGIKITAAQDQTKQTKSLTAEEEAEQLMRQGVIDAINWFNAQQDKISQSQDQTKQTKSLTAEEEAEQLMRQGVIDAINWFNAQQDKISQSQQKTAETLQL